MGRSLRDRVTRAADCNDHVPAHHYQETDSSCGPGALFVVLHSFGFVNVSEEYLRRLAGSDQGGTSSSAVVRVLDHFGVRYRVYKHLPQYVIKREVCKGSLAIIGVNGWGGLHFIVVGGWDEERQEFSIVDTGQKKAVYHLDSVAIDLIRFNNNHVYGGIIVYRPSEERLQQIRDTAEGKEPTPIKVGPLSAEDSAALDELGFFSARRPNLKE